MKQPVLNKFFKKLNFIVKLIRNIYNISEMLLQPQSEPLDKIKRQKGIRMFEKENCLKFQIQYVILFHIQTHCQFYFTLMRNSQR